MKSFKQVFSYALILAMASQSLFVSLAKASEGPSRPERRFFKQFDRKFSKFADDVREMLDDESSSAEMNETYESMIIWLEQHGNYGMADAMLAQHDKAVGGIRARLLAMTTDQAHDDAVALLKNQIEKAGGFKNFMANAKAEMKKNRDVKCKAQKIGSYTLIVPVSGLGMLTGMAAVSALYSGVFTPVVLAWMVYTVGAEGFAMPWFIDNMLVGCYKERPHPDFMIMNPTP